MTDTEHFVRFQVLFFYYDTLYRSKQFYRILFWYFNVIYTTVWKSFFLFYI